MIWTFLNATFHPYTKVRFSSFEHCFPHIIYLTDSSIFIKSKDSSKASDSAEAELASEGNDHSADTKKPKSRKRSLVAASAQSVLANTMRAEDRPFKLSLYPPPNLDRGDSIVYFPSSMARMINSEDAQAFAKLLQRHCSEHCELLISRKMQIKLPLAKHVNLFSVTTALQAASVYSMQSTKIVGNQVHAVLHYQYTDLPQMHEYAKSYVTDPLLKLLFVTKTRSEMLKRRYPIATLSKANQKKVLALIETNDTIEVHGTLDLILTFDSTSRKITQLEYYTANTSIIHKGKTYTFA